MTKKVISHIQRFFTIENPLLLISLLIMVLFSRFSVSYFNDTHRAVSPDINFYAGEFVGHDLTFATIDQVERLVQGLPMDLGVGYGYTFTIISAWALELFAWFNLCTGPQDCQFVLYKWVVTISLIGMLSLAFLLIKNKRMHLSALVFLTAFLLGVPGSMGIESGNLDILLSVMFGCMLYIHRRALKEKNRSLHTVILGVFAGLMIQTKLFVLPLVLVFLICSTRPKVFFLAFLTTVIMISIIPGYYNAPINIFFTLQAAMYLGDSVNFTSGVVYGNNSTKAMAGGLIYAFQPLHTNPIIRDVLLSFLRTITFLITLLLPIVILFSKIRRRLSHISLNVRLEYSFFIVLNCYAVAAMILWPEVSLSYRFYYLIPLLFILFDTSKNSYSKQLLGIAVSALLIRSLFLWHARILNVFLLIFFIFFLMISISLWVDIAKNTLKRNNAT